MSSETVNILAVEDNPVDVLRLRDELCTKDAAKFDISSVETLGEAKRILGQETFHVILLDLGLPDSQGLDTFTEIRGSCPNIPIVVMSGLDDEAVAIEAVTKGAQDYLCKDRWDYHLLVRSLNYAIERHKILKQCKDATEASQSALKALLDAQERLELALNGADLVPWERNLRTNEASVDKKAEQVLGYSPTDLQRFQDYMDLVHPDDAPRIIAALDAHLRGETPSYEAEYRLRTKSDEWKWLLSRARVVQRDTMGEPVRLSGTFLDISSRKQAEEALRESEERFRAIFMRATDPIFVKDRERRYVQVNPAFESLVGRSANEIVGRAVADSFGKEFAEFAAEIDQKVLHGESVEGERTVSIHGIPVTLSYSVTPLRDSAGDVVGIFWITRDVTERKRLQASEPVASQPMYPSKAMQATLRQATLVAQRDSTVLLLGESGCGKDWLARYIHNRSERAGGPYFVLNCAAIAPHLAESELFGHEKGAFTGSVGRKRGVLELAEGGTLLLNEIGELSLAVQSKILTFLDTKKFTRVGGEKETSVNVRLIAATNRDLEREVEEGRFRSDLFYRLNVIGLHVPPLRERLEDIPVLVNEILTLLTTEMQLCSVPHLNESTMTALIRYDWPGNVRELRNVLERTLILWDGKRFDVALPTLTGEKQDQAITIDFGGRTLRDVTDEITRSMCIDALQRCSGNKKEAAKLLGIARDSLYRYLREFGILSSGPA
jgi:PAS domain S-box-containing protein